MSEQELQSLCRSEAQDYIRVNENEAIHKLLLRQKEMFGLPFKLIAEQIFVRKKIKEKVPFLYEQKGIVFPPSLNLEQSSSEEAAQFKTRIFFEKISGKSIIDLTGGFGIDSLFFSKQAKHIDFVERDEDLLRIVSQNFKVLKIKNVSFHSSTAEDFLWKHNGNCDLIYADPSRRNEDQRKVFKLADCSPSIPDLRELIFRKSKKLLIKTSPLLDISKALEEIPFVKNIVVLSIQNECKELLFFSEKDFVTEPIISTFNITKSEEQSFSFTKRDELNAKVQLSEPQKFLYEPNASILKAGAFKIIAEKFDLKKIHSNTHLYTSEKKVENFPGRIFQIESFKPDLKKDFGGKQMNVISRNYPLRPEEVRKKFKIKDGGEEFLIAFSGMKSKHIVLASRLK